MFSSPRSRFALTVILVVVFGLWLRGRQLAATPPTGDEAESAINALTILQTGLPKGTYLGLPIYENCLTETWPQHPEYEFRDSSYSSKDLAIYHGWLPLYAMALSQKMLGVTPDEPGGELTVRHSDEAIQTRVIAARLPSVLFGGVFMIVAFLLAWEMFGKDAALAALCVAAIGRPFVYMAREARYHSATLALTTACCYAIWRIYRYNRWQDHLLAAVVMALLFHTHLLGFVIASTMFGLTCLIVLRRELTRQTAAKIGVLGLIVAASATPWMLLSGFLDQTAHIPPARAYLSFPADLIYYPIVRIPYLILPTLGLIWLAVVFLFHDRLPAKVTKPLDRHQRQIAFLLAWIAIGILGFTLLVPAASYFYKRLTLAVMGPGVVWGAILFAAAARAWRRQWSIALAPISFVVAIVVGNMAHLWFIERPDPTEAYDTIARLRTLRIDPDTRIYCTPNHQLTLTYLTGMPVQSVAPVRKRFIDSYPGPILIIDSAVPHEMVSWQELMRIAAAAGHPLTKAEAKQLEGPLSTWLRRQELPDRVASVEPPLSGPSFAQTVADHQRQMTRRSVDDFHRKGANNPLLRAYRLNDWSDWWPLFFYRFVDPEKRMGENLNYAQRIRTARAEVLDCAWVLYHCPPLTMVRDVPTAQVLTGGASAAAR